MADHVPDWELSFLEQQAAEAEHAAVPERCEHAVGWHCEHYDMTRLPGVSPSSRIINAQCGCTMVPTYAKQAAGAPSGDAEMLRRHGVERCAICGVVLRSHAGRDHPWTGEEPLSGEDRIREVMAEAQDHPGRIVTR